MKSEKIRLYIIEISLIIFFLLTIIFRDIITRQIIGIILLVFMVISLKLIRNDKTEFINNSQIVALMAGIGIIYVVLLYILGIFTGFYTSTIQISMWSILNYIIPYIVIIISSEIIRKTILLKDFKYSKMIMLVAMVMLDIILSTNIYNLKTTNDYFVLISFVLFASIANNLLFNHIVTKYRNFKAVIVYRIITTLYMYILPITPDIYIFLECVIKIVIPYIIYIVLEGLFAKNRIVISTKQIRKGKIINIIFYILVIIVVILISGKFKYGVLVIGSGSMTGTINKGDIVFYEKYGKNDKIKTGEIIIFNKDDMKIVHRVIDQRMMGTEIRYYTKGDANEQEDDGYRERKNIIGQVKGRIPYIGYLTLWVNDLIGGNN